MSPNKEQVQLTQLVFTQHWEDPICDHRALEIQPGETIMGVTSGGCNILGFLLFDPGHIYSIDINPAQSALLELKMGAMRYLQFEDFRAFSGLTKCADRLALFRKIRPGLSSNTREFWDANTQVLEKGFIMQGRYDRFVRFAGRCLKLLQGSRRIRDLLAPKNLEEQQRYYDEVWNTRRYRAIYPILFNKYVLARKGLSADYFQFDDGSTSFAQSFYRRARNAFRDLPIVDNYFLSLYVTGHYSSTEQVPDYLKREHFETIRSRLDRIEVITRDAQGWMDSLRENRIDCFALSNICELMSEGETLRLFSAVRRVARPGARVIFRNLMIPREVPESLRSDIIKEQELSKLLASSDRSFVYGKVAAYRMPKKKG